MSDELYTPPTMKCVMCSNLGETETEHRSDFSDLFLHANRHAKEATMIGDEDANSMLYLEICFPNFHADQDEQREQSDHDEQGGQGDRDERVGGDGNDDAGTNGEFPENMDHDGDVEFTQPTFWNGYEVFCADLIRSSQLDEKGRVTCQICGVPVSVHAIPPIVQMYDLVLGHAAGHLENVRYSCPNCNLVCNFPSTLQDHSLQRHGLLPRQPISAYLERSGGDRADYIQVLKDCFDGKAGLVGNNIAAVQAEPEPRADQIAENGNSQEQIEQPAATGEIAVQKWWTNDMVIGKAARKRAPLPPPQESNSEDDRPEQWSNHIGY